MTNKYLVFLGLCLELSATFWLIGNPYFFNDFILALLLHVIASACFAIGASRTSDKAPQASGVFALFSLSLLLPLAGPLVFSILTSDTGRARPPSTPSWQIIEPLAAHFNHQHLSTAALQAQVRHGNTLESRLSALKQTTKLGSHAAKPILKTALEDPSEMMRREAFSLLEEHSTEQHSEIGKLLEIMDKDPNSLSDTQVQAEAASQLWELAYQGRTDIDATEGFLQRAHAHLQRAMENGARSPELYFQRGRIQLKLNTPTAARASFETAIRRGQSKDEVLPYLAECAFNEGRYALVLPYLQQLPPIRQHSERFSSVLSIWSTGV